MKAYVFTDKALAEQAGRFVWLSINTEKATGAPFLKKYPVRALPTFFWVEPDSETVAFRWLGGATVPHFMSLLDHGHQAVMAARGGATDPDAAARLAERLALADRLTAAERDSEAVVIYDEVLATAPADWPGYGRTVESFLYTLTRVDDPARGVAVARGAFERLARSPSAAAVAAYGLDFALQLPTDNPGRAGTVAFFEKAAQSVLDDPTIPATADDRSGVYITAIGAREAAHDSLGARALTERWATFLEEEAAKAATPDARAVFDSHRLSAYLELGQPERAIPMLEASERDLPTDYNPPARLAATYRAMKEWDKALAASDRALKLAYGPRRLGYLQTRADLFLAKGDQPAARAVLEGAIAEAEALPEGQRSQRTIDNLKKKLDSIGKS